MHTGLSSKSHLDGNIIKAFITTLTARDLENNLSNTYNCPTQPKVWVKTIRPDEVIIFIKFHKDRTKNVNFSLMAKFLTCLILFDPDFKFHLTQIM